MNTLGTHNFASDDTSSLYTALTRGEPSARVHRAVLEALDKAEDGRDMFDAYHKINVETGCDARAYSTALIDLQLAGAIDMDWDHADEHHMPLDDSRTRLTITEAGCELLAEAWHQAAQRERAALTVSTPAYCVRFDSREAMRAYMSGGAA